MTSKDLSGRTIVITGASRGVGRDLARACSEAGADLVLADLLTEEGNALAEELCSGSAKARFVPIDLEDPKSIDSAYADIKATEGRIHGLVNNAAIATNVGGDAFEDIDIDLWDRVMRVNVRGTWLVTARLSSLLENNIGRVVNLASDTALWGPPKLLAYVTSKGAVISMTRALARELGMRRIGIVAVAPGLMRNPATEYVPAERHQLNEAGRAVPGPISPTEICDLVIFGLSDGALALTGQLIAANNGFVYS